MKPFFKDVFEYTYHFNDKVIDLLLDSVKAPEKSVLLINHTLNAQEIWNNRIEEDSPKIGVWDIRPLEGLKEINAENFKATLRIIDLYNFDKKVKYKNSKGQEFENTIKEMLFHTVNHSTYHRGQIATDCKMYGIEPLVTDYIFYKRVNL